MPPHNQSDTANNEPRLPDKSRGFTLLELLIVVVIIGVLTAIAIPAYNSYLNKAKITMAQSTLDTIRKTLESYHIDYQDYPDSIDFVTGMDGLGRTVFQPFFLNQINDDLASVDSYTKVGSTYTLVARATDDMQTVMTLTPENITY